METNVRKMLIGKYNGIDDYTVDGLPSVSLALRTSVPFISLSQSEGKGAITTPSGTVYNLSKKSVLDSNMLDVKATHRVCGLSVENEYLDEEKTILNPDYTGVYDRYTTIALMESIITKKEMVLVFDNIDGVFFVMPPVYCITDSIAVTACNGNEIHMAGYIVGIAQRSKALHTPYNNALSSAYKLNTTTPIQTTTHIMELTIYGSSGGNNDTSGLILNAAGSEYIETLSAPIIEMVSIGSPAALIQDGLAYTSKLMNISNGNYHPFNMGKVEVSDLLIPLYV